MFKFQKEQRRFRIGGVEFGGQPGQRRTAMLCPLQPHNDPFDQSTSIIEEVVSTIGVPVALSINATDVENIALCLEVARDLDDIPIFIDPPDISAKLAGLSKAKNLGLTDRLVCGGLSVLTPTSVWENVQEFGTKAAVLSSANLEDSTLKGRIYALENGAGVIEEGLLDRAKRYSITMPLIDTGGPGSGGSGLRALFVAKAKWGLPCCCDLSGTTNEQVNGSDLELTSATISQAAGADIVFAGPPKSWKTIARSLAFVDSLMAQAVADM